MNSDLTQKSKYVCRGSHTLQSLATALTKYNKSDGTKDEREDGRKMRGNKREEQISEKMFDGHRIEPFLFLPAQPPSRHAAKISCP